MVIFQLSSCRVTLKLRMSLKIAAVNKYLLIITYKYVILYKRALPSIASQGARLVIEFLNRPEEIIYMIKQNRYTT